MSYPKILCWHQFISSKYESVSFLNSSFNRIKSNSMDLIISSTLRINFWLIINCTSSLFFRDLKYNAICCEKLLCNFCRKYGKNWIIATQKIGYCFGNKKYHSNAWQGGILCDLMEHETHFDASTMFSFYFTFRGFMKGVIDYGNQIDGNNWNVIIYCNRTSFEVCDFIIKNRKHGSYLDWYERVTKHGEHTRISWVRFLN